MTGVTLIAWRLANSSFKDFNKIASKTVWRYIVDMIAHKE